MTVPVLSAVPVAELEALRDQVARGCQILAMEGLVEGTLGHVSARVDARQMLIRARSGRDEGLAFTTPADVRLVDFDGTGEPEDSGYTLPAELPIHGETLRARPRVHAVVHAHPPAVLLCGLAGLPLRPVFGAYNIPALALAREGVPTYPRSVLIRRPELAREMLAAMGERPVCLLKGHGITVTGTSVAQAVVRAVNLNQLATVTLELARLGREVEQVGAADLAELPDLGDEFNDAGSWRYLCAKLRRRELR